jgi:hypothetical protein
MAKHFQSFTLAEMLFYVQIMMYFENDLAEKRLFLLSGPRGYRINLFRQEKEIEH